MYQQKVLFLFLTSRCVLGITLVEGSLPPPTMKVVIKEWNAVATWKWNTPDDEVCGICRVQFDGTCPVCKYPGDDCPLSKFAAMVRIQLTT